MKRDFVKVSDILVLPTRCLYARNFNGFYVPCGKCAYCRKQYAKELAMRAEFESEDRFVYNVLLTYDDEHLPYHNGKPSLNKVQFDDFLKRFRSWHDYHTGNKLRYIAVGEYGGNYHRPHIHCIFFTEKRFENPKKDKNVPLSYIISVITQEWGKGFCNVTPMNTVGGNVRYLTQYLLFDDGKQYDKFSKPFRTFSRDGGIGHRWIERNKALIKSMVSKFKYTIPVTRKDGTTYEQPLPRYIRRKIMLPEHAIAVADEHYYYSQDYEEYIKQRFNKRKISKDYETKRDLDQFRAELKWRREHQREQALADYRKAKIHKRNQSASAVFKRD